MISLLDLLLLYSIVIFPAAPKLGTLDPMCSRGPKTKNDSKRFVVYLDKSR